jgi:LacI family transcriptional regulator
VATIKDVALLAKVGLGTASRAISGKGSVSPDALQRVQEAVRRLDFRPSRTARALASKSLGLVGVFVPTFEGTYFAPILQAIESELRAHDQHMVAASNFGHGTRRSKSLNGLRFLVERECDGILSVDSYTLDEDLRALRRQMPRLVLINRVVPGLEEDCFSIDHHHAGRLAARALLAHGHRALATMHSVRHSPEVVSRMEGFRAELAAHGLLPAQEFVIDGLLNFANAWQQAGEIVGLRKRPFTALFCATDVLAMATLSRLQAAGIRVPRDLSVLGYDGAELGAYTSPALSTVHVPSTAVATHACRHLINQCYGTRLELQRHFEAEVVLRQSIAPGLHPPLTITP